MPSDAEGWPDYADATPVVDNDHDGMADDWEVANGFDPTNAEDRNVIASADGYTALEIYLNSLMGETIRIITTAIAPVKKGASMVNRQYFSLNGRQSTGIQNGMNIIRETFSDGTTRTMKVMAKK